MRCRRPSKQWGRQVRDGRAPIGYLLWFMRVRDATTADRAFVMAANTALAAEKEGQALDPELLRAGVQIALADLGLGRYYLAERAGQVLGQLIVTFESREVALQC